MSWESDETPVFLKDSNEYGRSLVIVEANSGLLIGCIESRSPNEIRNISRNIRLF